MCDFTADHTVDVENKTCEKTRRKQAEAIATGGADINKIAHKADVNVILLDTGLQ